MTSLCESGMRISIMKGAGFYKMSNPSYITSLKAGVALQ